MAPNSSDIDLLLAPQYGDPLLVGGHQIKLANDGTPSKDGRPGYALLVNNRYSYPALFHLAVFTDIMNIADNGLRDKWGIRSRSGLNKFLETASVINSIPFTVLMVTSNVAYLFTMLPYLWKFFRRPAPINVPGEAVFFFGAWIPGACWYVLITGLLPFIGDVYYAGYWLPRLVMPAISVFTAVAFWGLGQLPKYPRVTMLAKINIGLQMLFQIGLLIR